MTIQQQLTQDLEWFTRFQREPLTTQTPAELIRETHRRAHDLECLDCFALGVDVHGRCGTCGSDAVATLR